MTNPEDLIGRKSNNNDSETNKRKDKRIYVPRCSTKYFLAEAVLIANEPKFIVVRRNSTAISIESSINVENRVLLPIERESYFPNPYSFSSEQQLCEYIERVRHSTLSDLYYETKSFCSLFIDADNNHCSIVAMDITFTYFQDLLGLTHYLFFIGKHGSGKSNNLTMINLLGYRNFMNTDMTAPNIYQFLGNQEEAIGTLCMDEANNIDEDRKLMEICKNGYITGKRVARTDISNGRVQNAYYTFCYKAFAAERLPDGPRINGFNERIVIQPCYDGNPKYDISEVINPAGEQEYQALLDQAGDIHNKLFTYRLIHYFDPIPRPPIILRNREKQLFISEIRMYYNERVWNEIKSVISYFVLERRKRQLDTLYAFLYKIVNFLVKEQKSLQLKSSDIWTEVKNQLAGTESPHKPLSYDSERFGTIRQSQITKILMENFGAKKPSHHGNANSLIFNKEILEKLKMTYEVSIDIDAKVGIDGIDGDDFRYGMDEYVDQTNADTSTEKNTDENDVKLNQTRNETVKPENNSVNGIDGDDGIDIRENKDGRNDGSNKENNNDNRDLDNDGSTTNQSLTDHQNNNSQIFKTNSNYQMRKAVSTSAHVTTTNLSHVSQVSQPTMEAIAQFFYDEPYLPYHPPPPHELEDSPCKLIIRFDSHFSLYNCILHPDVQSYHLESIEHHIKFKNPEMYKSEVLKLLNYCHSSTSDL